jgi:type IV pilus assembly protein PilA
MLRTEKGMTLIELVMVIIIIGILAGVAMKSMSSSIQTSKVEATKKELAALADAIVGNTELISNGVRVDFGYVGDVGGLPPNLDALIKAPSGFATTTSAMATSGYKTWKGPYIKNSFTQAADDYKRDGWNILYAYDGGVTITSTGSGSKITKQFANDAADLIKNTIQGVVLDGAGNPPGVKNTDVDITITYPDGSGSTTSAASNPSTNGSYSFAGIPVGNHTILAINTPTNDTLVSYVTVLPRSTIINNVKFGSALWQASSASSGNGLQYSPGSARFDPHDNSTFQFDVFNNTGSDVTISWLNASYSHNPAAYYEEVNWGHNSVASVTNHRFGSGIQVDFNNPRTINNNSTITVELRRFVNKENGNAQSVNMAGTTFTITFSDDSIITFSL